MTAMEDLHTLLNYMNHRYSTNKNRYWWGKAHRARLIDSGQYIKTSEKPRLTIRWSTTLSGTGSPLPAVIWIPPDATLYYEDTE